MSRKLSFTNWQIVITASLVLIILAGQARMIKNNWRNAKGFEQEWVAGSMIGGFGYSFDPGTAWLGPYGDRAHYTPTAWVEPFYTFLLYASLKVLGEYGRLLLVLLNIVWLGASSVMVFLLVGEILNRNIGLIMAILFFLVQAQRPEVIFYIGNAALAGFLYCVIAYLLIRCLKNPSLRNCVFLGAVIGFANLNHAGSLLFAPLVLLVLLFDGGLRKPAAWRNGFVVLGTALLVLSPWILRNYLVFHTFIPVRSGFGWQLYIGNPGLARTFTTGIAPEVENTGPAWSATSPLQALRYLRDLKYDGDLASHSMDYVWASSPPEYEGYNEIQRDRVFLSRSLAFIWAEPWLTAKMAFWKTVTFLTFWELSLGLVSLIAFIGGLFMIRDLRVVAILVLVAGFVIPYAVSLPLYYRYRSPIEPMLFVLAGIFFGLCLQKISLGWATVRKPTESWNK